MDAAEFSMPRKTRNVLIGKVFIILLIGLALGYIIDTSSRRDYEKGLELTQESYLEDYEEYREELVGQKPTGLVSTAIFCFVLALLFFTLYELGGRVVGAIIGKVLDLGAGGRRDLGT